MIRFERSLTLGEVYRFLFVEVLSYQVLVLTSVVVYEILLKPRRSYLLYLFGL